ncbi:ATP-binding protein [Roseospira goensis]|uniref:Helicase HerA central domain-containing protein n=1 Tax=Roseospira goensis TaxID=391922 RepID=A0A7W6S1P6_9PROT|nr:DUF87 domain-containing protein [Roseospira goensis]MBB4287096.1 hypothetical protein [Roseospira goensis]
MAETIGQLMKVHGSRVTAYGVPDGGIRECRPGRMVRIDTVDGAVIGVVGSVHAVDGAGGAPAAGPVAVDIAAIGEAERREDGSLGAVRRGVTRYPRIGDPVAMASTADLAAVFAPPSEATVPVGQIYGAPEVRAHLQVDAMLGRHFAILGTTGSGKSCTVALVLHKILEGFPHGHVVVLDPHDEYREAFAGLCHVVDPAGMSLPYWLMTGEELASVFLGARLDDSPAEVMLLMDALMAAKRKSPVGSRAPEEVTVDTPIPYRLSDLRKALDDEVGNLNRSEDVRPYLRLMNRLDTLMGDPRFAFMFSGTLMRISMVDVIATLLRLPTDGCPLTLVDLSGVPSEVVEVVVSLFCRMVFDFQLFAARGGDPSVPVLLVCEEAHRYAPATAGSVFRSTRRALGRIAKEGRKYGLGLGLISQRPSELDPEILSQCNTVMALRLSNERDLSYVRGALPDDAGDLAGTLPALGMAEVIAVGAGAPMPMRVKLDLLPPEKRPRAGAAAFSDSWDSEAGDRGYVEQVIGRWRYPRQ